MFQQTESDGLGLGFRIERRQPIDTKMDEFSESQFE